MSRLPGCTSRLSRAVVIAKGGLETTWYGRRGRRRSDASASTITTTAPKRRRKTLILAGWASMAITRAPTSSSATVREPFPAPTSSTRCPGWTPESATIRVAQWDSSSCHPHRRGGGTTDAYRQEHAHDRPLQHCRLHAATDFRSADGLASSSMADRADLGPTGGVVWSDPKEWSRRRTPEGCVICLSGQPLDVIAETATCWVTAQHDAPLSFLRLCRRQGARQRALRAVTRRPNKLLARCDDGG